VPYLDYILHMFLSSDIRQDVKRSSMWRTDFAEQLLDGKWQFFLESLPEKSRRTIKCMFRSNATFPV
jgi:hypothetical protein